ncbi:MAG TPA: hypothetical protein VNT20_19780 [Flavisolibacter sp.]|nr:hypothetical protein [Flavisolibacter sp.]
MLKKKLYILVVFFFLVSHSYAQNSLNFFTVNDSIKRETLISHLVKQFTSTSEFLDAAINSINSFNSLIKKENYRNKITSFNNPTSSDMGFSLENEIQSALKPLLAKAKNTNTEKFSQVVSSLFATPAKAGVATAKTVAPAINPLFGTLFSLVGTLTIQEKKITRDDLDSFINTTSKYFVQYEKLNQANNLFDQNIERLNTKLSELQFDMKEYMMDMITILYPGILRQQFKTATTEDLLLKYLDKQKLDDAINKLQSSGRSFQYPSDGIKSAKDISNTLQKLFTEYQKVYTENYQQIKNILLQSKSLGKSINIQQVDASLKELEELYNDSKNSDALSLRFTTLFERLKTLVATEQSLVAQK